MEAESNVSDTACDSGDLRSGSVNIASDSQLMTTVDRSSSGTEDPGTSDERRQNYSSENYKIEIFGLPNHLGYNQLKKMLKNLLKFTPKKISMAKTRNSSQKFVFATFSNEEYRTEALEKLNSHTFKGRKLTAKKAKPKSDPILGKRGGGSSGSQSNYDEKRQKRADTESNDVGHGKMSAEERLLEQTTPLHHLSYPEQLIAKADKIEEFVRQLTLDVQRCNQSNLLKTLTDKFDGKLCPVEAIKPSPVINGYRNKCEFTCGYRLLEGITEGEPATKQETSESLMESCIEQESRGENQKEESVTGKSEGKERSGIVHSSAAPGNVSAPAKQIGFRIGSYREGSVSVEPVHKCLHVSQHMKDVVKLMMSYVSGRSAACYDPRDHSGVYQTVTVRTSSPDAAPQSVPSTMMILDLWAQNMSELECDEEVSRLREFLQARDCNPTQLINSAYVRVKKRKVSSAPGDILIHVCGDEHITERVGRCTFRISPDAFFQVNTRGAEVLYDTIKSCCEKITSPDNTILLDICCGTGTIGQILAQSVQKVIGIEMCEQSVLDARANARLNGVEDKTEYICGKAEDHITSVLKRYTNTPAAASVIAVVDPPRSGLGKKLILSLRRQTGIKHLLYVSCNAKSAQHNFITLCQSQSNTVEGEAFVPVNIIPIDLFPHSNLYELVIVFTRHSSINIPNTSPPN